MRVRLTCHCVPVQLEGFLDDGRFVYFRYRSGICRIDTAESEEKWFYRDDQIEWQQRIGDSLDGDMPVSVAARILETVFREKVEIL